MEERSTLKYEYTMSVQKIQSWKIVKIKAVATEIVIIMAVIIQLFVY
jgi:hypothetical protein